MRPRLAYEYSVVTFTPSIPAASAAVRYSTPSMLIIRNTPALDSSIVMGNPGVKTRINTNQYPSCLVYAPGIACYHRSDDRATRGAADVHATADTVSSR